MRAPAELRQGGRRRCATGLESEDQDCGRGGRQGGDRPCEACGDSASAERDDGDDQRRAEGREGDVPDEDVGGDSAECTGRGECCEHDGRGGEEQRDRPKRLRSDAARRRAVEQVGGDQQPRSAQHAAGGGDRQQVPAGRSDGLGLAVRQTREQPERGRVHSQTGDAEGDRERGDRLEHDAASGIAERPPQDDDEDESHGGADGRAREADRTAPCEGAARRRHGTGGDHLCHPKPLRTLCIRTPAMNSELPMT